MTKASLALAILLTLGVIPSAFAEQTIVRDGSDYNGYANPGGCSIFVHDDSPTELHVGCMKSDKAARIRYRFLRDVGGQFAPADVSVEFARHNGDCSGNAVSWRVPVPRTLRVIVQPGCYVHILSVSWTQ